MKKKKRVWLILLTDIRLDFFCREKLDEQRVLHFMDLLDAGLELPPLEVVRNGSKYDLVAGHHTYAAFERLGVMHANCVILNCGSSEAYVRAVQSNANDQPLPMSPRDDAFALVEMLDRGCSKDQITRAFQHLPKTLFARRLKIAKDRIHRRKIREAASYAKRKSEEDLSEVAKKFKISLASLKLMMDSEDTIFGLTQLKGRMTEKGSLFKNVIRSGFQRLRVASHEGQVTHSQLANVVNHVESILAEIKRCFKDESVRSLKK